MANIDILAPFILSWEGKYANVPGDSGGPTNRGVTIHTWRRYGYDKNEDDVINEKDVMLITEYDAVYVIMKPVFWDAWKADEIRDQSVANLLVDWLWNSGSYGIRIPQSVLGVKIDGVVGPKTIAAVNGFPRPEGAVQTAVGSTGGVLQTHRGWPAEEVSQGVAQQAKRHPVRLLEMQRRKED